MKFCHASYMRALFSLLPALILSATPIHASRTLTFLGDSLTAGYGLDPSEAYPALIGERIKAKGWDWKVVNAGVSGDTTAGALRRLDWLFRQPVDVLFICLGANDGMRGVPVAESEKNLRIIIDRAKGKGATVVLAGIQIPENYGTGYRSQFSTMFSRIAKDKGVPYLPFLLEGVAMNDELNLADRTHPNAKGHRIMAETVWKVLEPVLAKR